MGNRRFIPMEAALLHWLRPYRKREGLLVPLVDSAVRRRMKKLCLHSKVNPPNNALRHSYASYWLARSSKEGLGELSKRIGFRTVPGFTERVIFRELFPRGLTLLDLTKVESGIELAMSHVAARQEIRELVTALKLPGTRKSKRS